MNRVNCVYCCFIVIVIVIVVSVILLQTCIKQQGSRGACLHTMQRPSAVSSPRLCDIGL